MLPLYPDIKPYRTEWLPVGDGHELYLECSGDPDGLPVLFVHGGPGGGSSPKSRCFFDPNRYHIIVYDQRGAGRSRPHASIECNTSTHLIDDIERIREHLGLDQWVLFGGSWGATLSLLYAQRYTERVSALILRGVFLCRQRDIDWFYRDGASRIYPDFWEDFVALVEDGEDLIESYDRQLNGDNELARLAAAKAWCAWEARCATLRPNLTLFEDAVDAHHSLAMARIENHYFRNDGFIRPNQILEDAHRLAGIPGIIVHGRFDMVCPLENALLLHEQWQDSELHIIRDAGHSAHDAGNRDALLRATEEIADLLRPADQESY